MAPAAENPTPLRPGEPRRWRWAAAAPLLLVLAVAGAALVRSGQGDDEPAAAAVVSCGDGSRAEAPAELAKPVTKGTAIVGRDGEELLMRGFNLIPVWGDNPGDSWEAADYACIRAKGFNTVRFVVYWDELEPEPGRFDETHLATLDRAFEGARAARLHVVLDAIHVFGGDDRIPEWARTGDVVQDVETHAQGYLTMLARRYRDDPSLAAYDPVNEPPTDTADQSRMLGMYATTIAWLRAVDPETIIMIEPAAGDSSLADEDLSRFRDARHVVLSVHDYYAGGAGDGYADGGAQEGTHTWNEQDGYPAPNAAELEEHLLVNLRAARAAGLSVWVGEFGINPAAANADRWIEEKIALFKKHDLGYAWWAYEPGDGLAALEGEQRFKPFVDLLL